MFTGTIFCVDDVKVISHPTASFAAFVTEPGDQLLDEPEEDSFPSNSQSFQFRRIDYEVEDEGSVHEVVDDTLETIQVPTGWLSYAKANLGHPQAGYLAKGLYKYAFKVSWTLLPTSLTLTLVNRRVLEEGCMPFSKVKPSSQAVG